MADDDVVARQDAPEFATVQLVREMIEEAHEVQMCRMDQKIKEMSDQLKDHFTALIKPLENAIGVLQRSNLVGHPISEERDLAQVGNQGQELAFTVTESLAYKKPKMTNFSQQNSSQSSLRPRQNRNCFRCGRYHKGRCHATSPLCYKCGDPGHLSLDCPLWENFRCNQCGEMGHLGVKCLDWQSRSRNRGSVARRTVTFAPTAPGNNMGTFTINAHYCLALSDFGITWCFVSYAYLRAECKFIWL